MRCLSVQQPYAWAICAGLKDIENRTYKTVHRGRIAIHASKKWSGDWCNQVEDPQSYSQLLARGAVIGVVDLVDIQSLNGRLEENPWSQGPYCWILQNPRLIQRPIPMKGEPGLFYLSSDIEGQLEKQLALPPLDVDAQTATTMEDLLLKDVMLERACQLGVGDAAGMDRMDRKMSGGSKQTSFLSQIVSSLMGCAGLS